MMKWTRNKRVAFVIIGAVLFFLGLYVKRALNIPAGAILISIGALLVYGQFHLPRLKAERDRLFIRIGCVFFAASMVASSILFLISLPSAGYFIDACGSILTVIIWFIPLFNRSPLE